MNRYVKVKPSNPQINLEYSNWFLVMEPMQDEPRNLSEIMQEKLLRTVCTLHGKLTPREEVDGTRRMIMAATRELDYESLANKYGTLLIRPSGSYMFLSGNEILEEKYCNHFPIDKFADIVICENDKSSESKWVSYLKTNYPDKSIATINFFDLRDDQEIKAYFENASLITFSTTFEKFEWFEKLTRLASPHNEIVGYCHYPEKWDEALKINDKVKVIFKI